MTGAAWSDPGYAAIHQLVRERAGLLFLPNRQPHAESSMRRAMRRARVETAVEYAALLHRDETALDDLLAELTIGETYFFREPAQFAYLREVALPALRERHGRDYVVRAWSAGCATGEEAYSLAITIRTSGMPLQVIGTDISRARLGFARRALYRQWSLRGAPAGLVTSHFTRDGEGYLLRAGARERVEFRYLNLARDVYPAISTGIWGMDLILCRNVLIYLDAKTISRVATRLIDTLSDDGVLLLGASDPLLTEYVPCEVVKTPAGVAYRRPGKTAPAERADRTGPRRAWADPGLGPAIDLTPGHARADLEPPREPIAARPEEPAPAARYDDAAGAYSAHDYEQVLTLARGRTPADASACILVVRALANLGRLEEAGLECSAALEAHRTSVELLYLHAVLLSQAGRAVEAADAARRALYLDRGFIVGHLALAAALARSGDGEGALRAYAAAERLLARMAPEAIVPASDGEPAGRLVQMARLQKHLVGRGTE